LRNGDLIVHAGRYRQIKGRLSRDYSGGLPAVAQQILAKFEE